MTLNDIIKLDVVISGDLWEKGGHSRVYLRLAGYSGRFRGDRTTKVYWDNRSGKLVIDPGRGVVSSELEASLQVLEGLQP